MSTEALDEPLKRLNDKALSKIDNRLVEYIMKRMKEVFDIFSAKLDRSYESTENGKNSLREDILQQIKIYYEDPFGMKLYRRKGDE